MIRRTVASAIVFVLVFFAVPASAAPGGITPGFDVNQTPYVDIDGDATPDQINWNTTNGTAVVVDDTDLSGEIWSEGFGWIKLDPLGGGVTNDGAGNLSGYAWGHNAGWISFDCNNGSNCGSNGNFGVTINPTTGDFNGFAWSENFGWVEFTCPGASTCINTDWRPNTTPPGGPSGGGNPDCNDGSDNDGDGYVDYPNDPGCTSPTDNSEGDAISGYACSDGVDNDGDGYTDYPSDPGCVTSTDTSEFNAFAEVPTLEEVTEEPTDVVLEVLTTDESLTFDTVSDTTIEFFDPNGNPIVRELNNAYYIPAHYETEFQIHLKRPAKKVWSYVVFQGDIADSREVINESHNIIERLLRMFFVQYAQAEGISDQYVYTKESPYTWFLKYVTPEKPGVYEYYTVVEYENSQTEVIRTDMVVVEFNGDTFQSNLIFGNWRGVPATVSIWGKNATTGEFELTQLEQGKTNPMLSNESGLYSFVVPQGDYKIKASKPGYYDFESEVFEKERNGAIVNYRIEVVCKFFGSFWCGWEIKLIIIAVIVYYLMRRKSRKKKPLSSSSPAGNSVKGDHDISSRL